MISPFKAVIGDAYKGVEARLLAAIHLRFGLPAKRAEELDRLLKAADHGRGLSRSHAARRLRPAEARRFFGPPPRLSPAIERDYLTPWPAEVAETRLRERFDSLARE